MVEINLQIDIDDLRSIYTRNGEHRHFFGPNTKRQSISLLIAIISFPFFVNYALPKEESWMFVLGTIFFGLICFDYWKVAMPIIKWKRSIEVYIEIIKQVEVLTFQYDNKCVIHTQDQEIRKENWEVIEKAIINDRFIWLISDTNFLLPRKSMTDSEFEALGLMVMKKVKNVAKN